MSIDNEEGPIEKEFQDVIHTKQKTLMFIRKEEQAKSIYSDELYPIITILRQGNFTVKEIIEYYKTFSHAIRKAKKSDKTIYRYLKKLKEVGLIDIIGQRVTKGQTATEAIWGRVARMFYLDLNDEKWMNEHCRTDCVACSDEGSHMGSYRGIAAINLLRQFQGNVDEKINYGEWMEKIDKLIKDEIKLNLDKLGEKELDHLTKLPYTSLDRILLISSLLSIFKRTPEKLAPYFSIFHK